MKFFKNGYGFIEMPLDCPHTKGKDVFLHVAQWRRIEYHATTGDAIFCEKIKAIGPVTGDLVVFQVESDPKGFRARRWAPYKDLKNKRAPNVPDPDSVPPLRPCTAA